MEEFRIDPVSFPDLIIIIKADSKEEAIKKFCDYVENGTLTSLMIKERELIK